jgi:hypothetical protein
MTDLWSSTGTVSRSRVYLGFSSWNPFIWISLYALSWEVVSGVPVKNLTTSPPPC